jgi:dipeptidyl aminopeptidase/acylaminoacyl peptidase
VRVPTTEADQLLTALTANNIVHEYCLYPDEGHGLSQATNRLDFYTHVERFLAKHVPTDTTQAQTHRVQP